MTGRERILATLAGELPDYVPFCPNLYQWFYYHLYQGSLPPELERASHPIDALRCLGADVLARWDTAKATRAVYREGRYQSEYLGNVKRDTELVTGFNTYPPGKVGQRQEFETPYGTLSQQWVFRAEAGTDFEAEHWWKDYDSEYDAIRFMLEAKDYEFDYELFAKWVKQLGEDGVVMLQINESPLKMLHWLAGQEKASTFIMDHPSEMKDLARIHEEKTLAYLERVVDVDQALVFVSLDNLDSMFYSPAFFRDFCLGFFAQAAEIVHSRSKFLFVHSCGRNRVLMPLVGQAKIDCLEGLTPPPLGDVALAEARQLIGYERFTVNGGMISQLLEMDHDAQTQIHGYTRQLFEEMAEKSHFIFGSSCNTSPLTPWENLKHFRDAAREYGRIR